MIYSLNILTDVCRRNKVKNVVGVVTWVRLVLIKDLRKVFGQSQHYAEEKVIRS